MPLTHITTSMTRGSIDGPAPFCVAHPSMSPESVQMSLFNKMTMFWLTVGFDSPSIDPSLVHTTQGIPTLGLQ